ncbi:hypothetical protein IMZ48_48540 [Candidatus Bathyarchaeota archaeon]|nr:hypothetical protein [Candidatus Bathyarchaeota archaeon]
MCGSPTNRGRGCRNLYYEESELYGSQARVDQLVDDLAVTLGVGRHDLGIVRGPALLWVITPITVSGRLRPARG